MSPQSTAQFRELLDLGTLPSGWKVARVAFDWNGEPLVLIDEGKPPEPADRHDILAVTNWMNSPPKARHLICWRGDIRSVLRFDGATGTTTAHVQRFGDGWLLGDARSGRVVIYDRNGKPTGSELDLGDASEDIQVTRGGLIWVSYFDEGVFGGGIGQSGLVCFNSDGQAIFRYSEFAERHKLPFVDDLYAMNVVDDSDVWISYYSDFPIVHIKNREQVEFWNDFGPIKCLAVDDLMIVAVRAYEQGRLERSNLRNADWSREELMPVRMDGTIILPPFRAVARLDRICLSTESKIYMRALAEY